MTVQNPSNDPKSSHPVKTPKFTFGFMTVAMGLWIVVLVHDWIQADRNVAIIPYSEFLTDLDAHQISEAMVSQERVEGTLKQAPQGKPKGFVTMRADDPDLTKRMQAAGVKFGAMKESTILKDILGWTLPVLIFFGLWSVLFKRMGGARPELFSLGKSKAKVYAEKGLKTRFSDVAGVEEAKIELKEVVEFLRDPKKYSRLGGRMPKGVLLVGPPGTGKTLLARAVAGEAEVPFFSINGSEFVEMFVGLGAARVSDLFQQARASSPCMIFIDELDAIGKARGVGAMIGSSHDEREQTLNQLLAELDGFDSTQGIILLAATNRPEVLDPALLRSGRFDRQILVDKPDRIGRREILAVHLKGIQLAADIDPQVLASMTAGFSGADLANLVNEGALIATRRNAENVEMKDFTEAIERIVAGLERKNRILGPKEKSRVAYHEMGHATVALALGEGEVVHKVTIIPRGIGALGYTFRRATEDRYLMAKHELENSLTILLGGRAAEMCFLREVSTGAADDLDKASELARAMITRYGMSETLGPATLAREPASFLAGGGLARNEYSEATAERIDAEVGQLIDRALHAAQRCVRHYRGFVEAATLELIAHETLDEAQLKALWEKHRGENGMERSRGLKTDLTPNGRVEESAGA